VGIPSDGALRRPGPKLALLILTGQERETLQRWSRRAKSSQALALRSRIVLACAGPEAPAIVQVARQMGITPDTVRKWRRRFLADRLDGLVDERQQQPVAIGGGGKGPAGHQHADGVEHRGDVHVLVGVDAQQHRRGVICDGVVGFCGVGHAGHRSNAGSAS
jgi:hypothetical protein